MTSTMYLKTTLRRGNCYHMPLPAMNYIFILLLLLSPVRYVVAEVLSGPTTGDLKNKVKGDSSVVAGGRDNTAQQRGSAVLGGLSNVAGMDGAFHESTWAYAVVGGGIKNTAIGNSAVVAGGALNTAEGGSSAVSGGSSNKATGLVSTVLGGFWNEASGVGSIAMGAEAYATNQQSFVVNMLSDCLKSGGYIDSECNAGKRVNQSENGIESTNDKEIVFAGLAFTIRIGPEPEDMATIDSSNIKRFIELLSSPSPTETPTEAPTTTSSSQNPSVSPSSAPSTNTPSLTPSLTPSTAVPSTTSTILPECKDRSDTFLKNELGKPKGCKWVRAKNTKERCDREVLHDGQYKPARELCCESCDGSSNDATTIDNSINNIYEDLAKLQASIVELQASNMDLQAQLQELQETSGPVV